MAAKLYSHLVQMQSGAQRITSWLRNAGDEFRDLAEATLVAGTFRWLAVHTPTVMIQLLSLLTLAYLFVLFVNGAMHVIDLSRFDKNDAGENQAIAVTLFVTGVIGAALYCYGIYSAVDQIGINQNLPG